MGSATNRSAKLELILALVLGIIFVGPFSVPAIADHGYQSWKVMTQNLYVGADIARPTRATTPQEFVELAEETFEVLLATIISERIQALTNEITSHRPHLIGLQEVYHILRPALGVDLHYLSLLLDALDDMNVDYRVAAAVQNSNLMIPIVENDLVMLIDRDVILV